MNIFSKRFLSLIVFFLSFGVLKPFTSYEILICDYPEVLIVQSVFEESKSFRGELELVEFLLEAEKDLCEQEKENTEEEQDFISQEENNNSVSGVDQNPVSELEAREIFGFSGDFTQKELKDRYKRLLMRWHPDKNIGNEEQAKEMSGKIINANERLKEVCKPEK